MCCVCEDVARQQCRSVTRIVERNWQHDLCTYRQVVCLFVVEWTSMQYAQTGCHMQCHMQCHLCEPL